MKKYIAALMIGAGVFASCSDELELRVPYPTNITLNELELGRFTHNVPDGGFKSDGIHFNTVKDSNGQLEAGFCYSNRSMRSFTWAGDEISLDSVRYSVWTTRPNTTKVYAVCHVKGDDAYFTLDKPSKIEYLLVSNTTWNYLAMTYGDEYCEIDKETGEKKPVANPNVPSKPLGIWKTYIEGGVKKFGDGDYFRITAKGYKGGSETGTATFDLACKKGANTANPDWNYIVKNWTRWDLASLGEVDKVVFYLDSSDKDEATGKMRTPAWFCIDGIQLVDKK